MPLLIPDRHHLMTAFQARYLFRLLAGGYPSAVAAAAHDAEDGETVLLAPAAASFDQYDSFERRGEDFIAQVEALG